MKAGKIVIPPDIAALTGAAGKCTVRECDETENGQFVAYVDEGKDSRDVSVQLDAAGKMISYSCDCGGAMPCRHVAALALFLSKGEGSSAEKPKVKKAKVVKERPSDALLNDLDAAEIRSWLRGVFPQNKELELAFVYHFSERNKRHTPAEVKDLTLNAVKTVLKRSTKADATQMKKILELWKELHAPVIDRYLGGPADEDAFLSLHALFNACLQLKYDVQGAGKAAVYVQRILESLVPHLAALAQEEGFERATGFFIDRIPKADNEAGMPYAAMIKELSDVCSPGRRIVLARRIADQYGAMQKGAGKVANPAFAAIVLSMVEGAGLFREYYALFQPIRWSNDYNIALIRALIGMGETGKAEDYAWAQVNSNSNEDYNQRYLEVLEKLYKEKGNKEGLVKIARLLLPDTFNFEHYLLILSYIQDEDERKKFRQKIFTRARHTASYNQAAARFSLRLLAHEEKWTKIIDLAKEASTPFAIILQYFDQLLETNKKALLKSLLGRRSEDFWMVRERDEADLESVPALAKAMMDAFGAAAIQAGIKEVQSIRLYTIRDAELIQELKRLLGGGV